MASGWIGIPQTSVRHRTLRLLLPPQPTCWSCPVAQYLQEIGAPGVRRPAVGADGTPMSGCTKSGTQDCSGLPERLEGIEGSQGGCPSKVCMVLRPRWLQRIRALDLSPPSLPLTKVIWSCDAVATASVVWGSMVAGPVLVCCWPSVELCATRPLGLSSAVSEASISCGCAGSGRQADQEEKRG